MLKGSRRRQRRAISGGAKDGHLNKNTQLINILLKANGLDRLLGRLDWKMTSTATSRATGSAAWADTLLRSFVQAGYGQAEPPILQPAEPFLDLSGEDIRKSLYLTTDASGEELCLRPDLTIPVARDYLASGRAGRPAGYSYLGPVFRYRGGRPSEFLQAGIESFGRQDRAAADAEMLALEIGRASCRE